MCVWRRGGGVTNLMTLLTILEGEGGYQSHDFTDNIWGVGGGRRGEVPIS